MNKDFINALDKLTEDKGLDRDMLIDAMEKALERACQKNYETGENVLVEIDTEKGDVVVALKKEVVEEVENPKEQISLEDAREISAKYEVGDIVNEEVTPKDFGRIAAQTAKQIVVQKIREAEREKIYNEYVAKENEVVTGIVRRVEQGNVFVDIGKTEALLPKNEQMINESYNQNDRIKVYIKDVSQGTRGPQVFISRSDVGLVKRLFEKEVPEIYDGVIEIKAMAREGGSRTKMAVHSNDENVDPIGSCVGRNGSRIGIIVDELSGEKIDIIHWNEDPKIFIAEALSPSDVLSVTVDEDERKAEVVVPDDQLSLAIGKAGQNVRLAARMTGYKIDIKSKSEVLDG